MSLKSWLPIPPKSHFSLSNIPFGIISTPTSKTPRPAVAIGDHALDLAVFAANSGFSHLPSIQPHLSVFSQSTLNDFAALGQPLHREVRRYLQEVFQENSRWDVLSSSSSLKESCIFPLKDITTHCPLRIGDYTDFYAGKNHAFNAGALFRGPKDALQPNYSHLPVGYHGRASSIVVSGTPIRRPWGQILENPKADPKVPIFAPSRRLDFELELGAFVCRANKMGEPVAIGQARESLFGMVLLNDWSARDIQAWEYVPLGPFNGKNFGTTISAWVVLADALKPFMGTSIKNDTKLLPYLDDIEENVYDINLEVDLTAQSGESTTITRANAQNLLFSFPQMLTQHSINGCPMQVGDLLGSGTISGTSPGSQGSLLEQSRNGTTDIELSGGERRTFLEDFDTVTLRGWAGGHDGELVGFGECVGRIEPAVSIQ
ncbi:hypothetical protein MMC07_006473 [Pseudocyphellaria aurata]|nr:hypothetical protein [Pseudocyphellaria aurata]